MKKYSVFCLFCLLAFFPAAIVHAQWGGFTGPGGFGGEGGAFTPYTGPSMTLTVAQASNLPNKAPVILTGVIVQHLGNDRYLFRDDSGEMPIKIKWDRWRGVSVGPSDQVEISGQIKRDKKNWTWYYTDIKFIRKK